MCNVRQLPGVPKVDASEIFPMNWRFFPTLDPQVIISSCNLMNANFVIISIALNHLNKYWLTGWYICESRSGQQAECTRGGCGQRVAEKLFGAYSCHARSSKPFYISSWCFLGYWSYEEKCKTKMEKGLGENVKRHVDVCGEARKRTWSTYITQVKSYFLVENWIKILMIMNIHDNCFHCNF